MARKQTTQTPFNPEKIIVTADPGIDYSKITVPDTSIHTFVELPSPDHPHMDLRLFANKQTEMENKSRRKQYLEQKLAEYQERLATTDLLPDEMQEIEYRIEKSREDIAQLQKEIDKLHKDLASMSETVAQKKHYDKYTLLSNISYALDANKTVKRGQIEREASGCQPGYMSRLSKKDNTTEPTLEFVVTAAQSLGLSVDLLLHAEFEKLTSTERYLIDFFTKLQRDTAEDKLKWTVEESNKLKAMTFDENYESPHPMFFVDTEQNNAPDGDSFPIPVLRCLSRSFGSETRVKGDFFSLRMKNDTTLYITNVRQDKNTRMPMTINAAIEVWMCRTGSSPTFVCSTKEHENIFQTLISLYNSLDLWANRPRVSQDLKTVIDAFMIDDLSDDAPESEKQASKKSGTVVGN